MTKATAIKILENFIEHKKKCVEFLGDDKFNNSQLESIRDTLKRLARSDQEDLEEILRQLRPRKNDSKRKKKPL